VSDSRARDLIVENGAVVGVVSDEGGKKVEHRGDAVVLACGGFEWNQDMWKAFLAVPWDGPATPPFNEGDSIVMAARAGAKLANLDKATWIQTRYLGEEYEGRPYMHSGLGGGYPGEILVNTAGRRFANENLNYNDIGRLLTHFDPHTYEYDNYPAYAIGDRAGLPRAASKPNMIAGDVLGDEQTEQAGDGYVRGDTLREVAEQLGIDPDGLERQVAEFNEHAVNGVDPVFRRGEKPWETHFEPTHTVIKPITEPPFYGYRVHPSVFGTRGGPAINANAEIVDWDNQPIPGLYGAGAATAHPFASAYPGGGGVLGPGVTFGHIAGKRILGQS
jgi:3-oxosteroid 1-dehydrogenase